MTKRTIWPSRWSPFVASLLMAIVSSPASGEGIGPDKARFRQWLADAQSTERETAGLYPYYKRREAKGYGPSPASTAYGHLSPMVSAEAILFWLQEADVERASRTGYRLLYWQSERERNTPRTAGALPSTIEWDGERWRPGERYYSGDNLVVLEAFVALFRRTGDRSFLRGAEKVATWIANVMSRGHDFGVWKEDHGAPMHFVTAAGDFDNRIFTNVELLWIPSLRHIGEITGNASYLERFERAKAFLLQGQSELGVWFDHYDPGYPPHRYDSNRWRWYGGGTVVLADNALRAALGALRLGAHQPARAFVDWFGSGRGPIPAYLDAKTARGRFDPSTQPYYDVVASGLWRSLSSELRMSLEVLATTQFLKATQNASGGWYWGVEQGSWNPVEDSEAVLTGLWAVSTPGS